MKLLAILMQLSWWWIVTTNLVLYFPIEMFLLLVSIAYAYKSRNCYHFCHKHYLMQNENATGVGIVKQKWFHVIIRIIKQCINNLFKLCIGRNIFWWNIDLFIKTSDLGKLSTSLHFFLKIYANKSFFVAVSIWLREPH